MFKLGNVDIRRIEESCGPSFRPAQVLPDWTAEAVAPHRGWLVPDYFSEEKGRLVMSVHSWLLRTRHHTILVDTCVGNHKERPGQPAFHMLDRPYLANLAAAGVRPEEIDYVLCTHLHVDHVGWNTRLADGRWVPTFPNARYVFSRTDRDFYDPARGAGGRIEANARVFNDSVLPILEARQDMVVEGVVELTDGITIEPAPGHSPGHVLIKLVSAGAEGLFTGDIMHHPMQIWEDTWSSAFCTDPGQARLSRRRVLEHACAHGSILYPAHFAGPHIGRVGERPGGFAFLPGRAV
ncbi:MAG: MBL fold metallo-hydrolase [Hyphomicrobiaceae bacterium]|nr:MBL fold metallo-hydrolase [Hyphomicrobiaceae bacterium]